MIARRQTWLRVFTGVLFFSTVVAQAAVTGRVVLEGEPPRPDEVIDTKSNAFCKKHGEIRTERWVGKNGGLANVVVTLSTGEPTASTLFIDQVNCRYVPHVATAVVGQPVKIRNSDPTYHNVRVIRHQMGTLNKGRNLRNIGQPKKGSEDTVTFDEPGVYRLVCDLHRWMVCWIHVSAKGRSVVSSVEGSFSFSDVADGTYTATAWHPQFGKLLSHDVKVSEGVGVVDFRFQARDALKK